MSDTELPPSIEAILEKSGFPVFVCPLYEQHTRAYVFQQVEHLILHLLQHEESSLGIFVDFSREVRVQARAYEEYMNSLEIEDNPDIEETEPLAETQEDTDNLISNSE